MGTGSCGTGPDGRWDGAGSGDGSPGMGPGSGLKGWTEVLMTDRERIRHAATLDERQAESGLLGLPRREPQRARQDTITSDALVVGRPQAKPRALETRLDDGATLRDRLRLARGVFGQWR
jgi:hypothetical protein